MCCEQALTPNLVPRPEVQVPNVILREVLASEYILGMKCDV